MPWAFGSCRTGPVHVHAGPIGPPRPGPASVTVFCALLICTRADMAILSQWARLCALVNRPSPVVMSGSILTLPLCGARLCKLHTITFIPLSLMWL